MTKHPTLKSVGMSRPVTDYGATLFRNALARYVVHFNNPDLSPLQVEQKILRIFPSRSILSPFATGLNSPLKTPILRQAGRTPWLIPSTFNRARLLKMGKTFLLASTPHL
jgi:hypothetical protein